MKEESDDGQFKVVWRKNDKRSGPSPLNSPIGWAGFRGIHRSRRGEYLSPTYPTMGLYPTVLRQALNTACAATFIAATEHVCSSERVTYDQIDDIISPKGISARIFVPSPGLDSSVNRPPTISTRSRIPINPRRVLR